MKRILHHSKPRSPLGIGLFLAGALLVALSAWQGFAALSKPTRDIASAQPVAFNGARFELRSIETIRPGEQVLAFDPETGEQAWRPVEHALVRVTDHLRILTIRDAGGSRQTIKTTDEHPFWVPDKGWTNAGELRPGDGLLLIDGQPASVVATTREEHPQLITVHNLTVAGLHTYHVSADPRSRAIVVHNARKCADAVEAVGKAGKEAASAMAGKAGKAADTAKGANAAGVVQPAGGTYKLRDADGTVKKTGRTKDLDRREGELARRPDTKGLEFEVDRRTDDYAQQRGLEKLVHDANPSAHVANGGLDKIRPIDPNNPKIGEYMKAAKSVK